jgi:sec-independent protein translocase protein TatA
MGIPSPTELILILVVAVMVFGPKRIPEIMDQVGRGIKTFKDSVDGVEKAVVSQPTPDVQPVASIAPEAAAKK